MSVIVTRSTASDSGSAAGAYTQAEKLAMEMEMAFKAANASYYKEFVYETGDLVSAGFWNDNVKTTRLFTKDFSFDNGALDQTLLTRDSDDVQLLSLFGYDGDGNLISKTVSAG